MKKTQRRRKLFGKTRRRCQRGGTRTGALLAVLAAAATVATGETVSPKTAAAKAADAPALGNALDDVTGTKPMKNVEDAIVGAWKGYDGVWDGLSSGLIRLADKIQEKQSFDPLLQALPSLPSKGWSFNWGDIPDVQLDLASLWETPEQSQQRAMDEWNVARPTVDSKGAPLVVGGRYKIAPTEFMDDDDKDNFAFRLDDVITYVLSTHRMVKDKKVWGHYVRDESDLDFFYPANEISLSPRSKGGRKTLRRKK
jgi:hypothetical protein